MQKNSIIPRERVRETDSFTDFCIEQAEKKEGRDGNWGRQRRWTSEEELEERVQTGGKKKKGEEIVETWEVGRRSRGWVGNGEKKGGGRQVGRVTASRVGRPSIDSTLPTCWPPYHAPQFLRETPDGDVDDPRVTSDPLFFLHASRRALS